MKSFVKVEINYTGNLCNPAYSDCCDFLQRIEDRFRCSLFGETLNIRSEDARKTNRDDKAYRCLGCKKAEIISK